ncbi:tetratricopeptide repeat protein [Luteimonas lutimaris]|uniref:Tetratricopeptide repeat protein n=1 Tax=Luteimonas lutimaris TaxID=698645 RepID=A0ABP7M7Q5_9GAMM
MSPRIHSAAPRGALSVFLLALAACTTQPPAPPPPAPLTTSTPQQQVAAIRAAGGDGEGELAVQPLRDPKVEDLRAKAERLEAQQHYDDAASTLDQALEIVPDDPALLQERAEAALLQGDHARAEALARRAFETGSQVGPLCRRHWATIEQSRLLESDAAGAAAAKAKIDACTVAGVNRY